MIVEFKERSYGYKVVDKYGDKLGEIHTDGNSPLFEASKKGCSPKTLDEMKEITNFMEGISNGLIQFTSNE